MGVCFAGSRIRYIESSTLTGGIRSSMTTPEFIHNTGFSQEAPAYYHKKAVGPHLQ